MKLLLIFSSWSSVFGSYSKVAKKASSFPPLNLCYIGAIAEKAGWDVEIIDAELEELNITIDSWIYVNFKVNSIRII